MQYISVAYIRMSHDKDNITGENWSKVQEPIWVLKHDVPCKQQKMGHVLSRTTE